MKYQDPQRKGVCGTGYLWVFHNPMRNVSLFAWHTSRSAACLESIVPKDYAGTIQCDGYSAYDAFARSTPRCWSHPARRLPGPRTTQVL